MSTSRHERIRSPATARDMAPPPTRTVGARDWRAEAACRHGDPELFFPEGTAGPALRQVERAKHVCRACPVAVPCLGFALGHGVSFGIWGGTTEEERRVIRNAASRSRPGRPATR